MTKIHDVIACVQNQNIQFCRLEFTDILGMAKSVAIPSKRLPEAFEEGIPFDGSSIHGFVRIEESDMLLVPDANTFTSLPWSDSNNPTAKLVCDIYHPNGKPFAGCPRRQLRSILEQKENDSSDLLIGCELEFFLIKDNKNGIVAADEGHYFDLLADDPGWIVRKEIVTTAQAMGIEIICSHHESAPGQQELVLAHRDALTTADHLVTLRALIKRIAWQHGFRATFMPKPFPECNGSGLHLHLILKEDDQNLFYDEADEHKLSATASKFIAGLLHFAREYSAVVCPLVNSYKRLVPGGEAPVHIAWSTKTRNPLVRIPACKPHNMRIELRAPDPTCNPYLAFAAVYLAALTGISNSKVLPAPVNDTFLSLEGTSLRHRNMQELPHTLHEALICMKGSLLMRTALGEYILHRYIQAKELEWEIYRSHVHKWEIDTYLSDY